MPTVISASTLSNFHRYFKSTNTHLFCKDFPLVIYGINSRYQFLKCPAPFNVKLNEVSSNTTQQKLFLQKDQHSSSFSDIH